MPTKETTYTPVYVARQPIFDADMNRWGYELYYRADKFDEFADIADAFEATFEVMTNLSLCPHDDLACGRICINFPQEAALIGAHRALPPIRTVLHIPESAGEEPYFLEVLDAVREEGYTIAIDDFTGANRELAKRADHLIIDLKRWSGEELLRIAQAAQILGAPLMGKKIETHAVFDEAIKLGFSLFQGNFFRTPRTIEGRKVSSLLSVRLKLFEILETPELDFDELSQVVETDAAISYRLLRFLNSASFGLGRSVGSIREAVVMLGARQIRNWLRIILLTDLSLPEKTRELTVSAAQRARFLEAAAVRADRHDIQDGLFMAGLFSHLDAMLDLPMVEVLDALSLPDFVRGALLGEPGEGADWLSLAKSVDLGDWNAVDALCARLGLETRLVEGIYREAVHWVEAFFTEIS